MKGENESTSFRAFLTMGGIYEFQLRFGVNLKAISRSKNGNSLRVQAFIATDEKLSLALVKRY